MKFSFIIGTLNRPEAISSCLNSLVKQDFGDFEVIIVDQSDNDNTAEFIKGFKDLNIGYKRVSYKGLSKSRNEALKLAKGEYICLGDDDAYYQFDYLTIASKNLRDKKTILSGYIYDTIKKGDFVSYNNSLNGKILPIRSIMRTCPSAGLVFPSSLVKDIGQFDDRFGVGSIYGSGEETDYLLRAINHGYKVIYIDNLKLSHPVPIPKETAQSIEKIQSYYFGLGALYSKHISELNERYLIPFYLEVKGKLLIKNILSIVFSKYNSTNKSLIAFNSGYKTYKEKVNGN